MSFKKLFPFFRILKLAKPPCKGGLGSSFVTLFASVLIATFLLNESPRGIPHPDALIFTQLCQSAIGTVERWQDFPAALAKSIQDCSCYDWNRGRITSYLLTMLGSITRPYLQTGFFDPVALGIMALNAWLSAAVLRKNSPKGRNITEVLTAALFCFSPFTLAAIQCQFIYSKYICTTFMLGALLAFSLPAKIFCMVAGVFSDEIGLLFGMIYGGVLLAEKLRTATMKPFFRTVARLACVGVWASFLWSFYHACLQIFFGQQPKLMRKSKFLPGWEQISDTFFYPFKTVLWGWGTILLHQSDSGTIASSLGGLPWPVWIAPLLLIGAVCLFFRLRPLPVVGVPWENMRDSTCLLGTLGVVNFVFYKGQVGDTGYYGYPLFVGLTLVLIHFLNYRAPRLAVACSALLALTTFLSVPATLQGNRLRISRELLGSSIQIERVADLEKLILATGHHEKLPEIFISGQEIAAAGFNSFSEKYFPIKGIARIFLWPRALPGEIPALRLEP